MSAKYDVLEERVSEAKKNIDRLRKHSHDLTNSFVGMSEVLKTVNKDLEKLFYLTTKLNDKIEKFRILFLDKIHNVELQNKDVVVEKRVFRKILHFIFSPKNIWGLIVCISLVVVAIKTDSISGFFKSIYHYYFV